MGRITRALLGRNSKNFVLAKYKICFIAPRKIKLVKRAQRPCLAMRGVCRRPHLLLACVKYLQIKYLIDFKDIFRFY
jgi:hypothetical protein